MGLEPVGRTASVQDQAVTAKVEPVKGEAAQGQKVQESSGRLSAGALNQPVNCMDNKNGQGGNEKDEEKKIKNAVQNANNQIKQQKLTRCEFSYHEDTKRVSIKVIDRQTQDVVREIPPEETLEMVEKMWELAGLLVDERR